MTINAETCHLLVLGYKEDMQGGGKRLPNYHLVGENCILVGENFFDLPDLVGENIRLLKLFVALNLPPRCKFHLYQLKYPVQE